MKCEIFTTWDFGRGHESCKKIMMSNIFLTDQLTYLHEISTIGPLIFKPKKRGGAIYLS
jgi:hypothetical protein